MPSTPHPAARIIPQDDPRGEACALGIQKVKAVIELANGRAFWEVFPNAGLAPELAAVDAPVYVAVLDGHWNGPMARNPLTTPVARDSGTIDVCVVHGKTMTICANIAPEGMQLPQS